jgi:hypothetical protein
MAGFFREYLPFVIPLALVQTSLMLAAVVHNLRHGKFRVGNRALWLVVSIAVGIVGPALYFSIGQGDER